MFVCTISMHVISPRPLDSMHGHSCTGASAAEISVIGMLLAAWLVYVWLDQRDHAEMCIVLCRLVVRVHCRTKILCGSM